MQATVRIPGACPRGGRDWPDDMRPLTMDDPRVKRLFAAGGALHGKKRFAYPIRAINADGTVDMFLPGDEFPLPRSKHAEALFTLAAIHTLGWPDAAHVEMLADGVYHDARIMLECDEAQHYDAEHYFNRLPGKEAYQSPRDWRVTLEFLRREYSVCRVRACDYNADTKRWYDVEDLGEVYRRTQVGIAKLLEARALMWHLVNADAKRKPVMIVWPDSPEQALARAVFSLDKLMDELRFVGFRNRPKDFERAANERVERAKRMLCDAARPAVTMRSRLIEPVELPSATKASAEAIGASGDDSAYARYWRALIVPYDSKAVLLERSTEIRAELARRNIVPATLAK